MTGRHRRLLRSREVVAFAVAVLLLLFIEVGLRRMRLPNLTRLLGVVLLPSAHGDPAGTAETGAVERAHVLAQVRTCRPGLRRGVDRALRRWPWGDTCLRRALAVGAVLRPLQPELLIGVTRVDGDVRAHAWLVVGGVCLDPVGSATFDVLAPVREVA